MSQNNITHEDYVNKALRYLEDNDLINAGKSYYKAAKLIFRENKTDSRVSWYYGEAATNFQRAGEFNKAGDYFKLAAENTYEIKKKCDNYYRSALSYEFVRIRDYSKIADMYYQSALNENENDLVKQIYKIVKATENYLRVGNKNKCDELVKSILDKVNYEIYNYKLHQYINELLRECDNTGYDELSRKIYIHLMNCKRKNCRNVIRHKWLWILWITCLYGESAGRFIVSTAAVILFFTVVYLPYDCKLIPEFLKLDIDNGGLFIHNASSAEGIFHNVACSIHFSITVFSTLGFGNITPQNIPAFFWVSFEVILGFIFLGVLVTLVSRKVFRK